MRIRVTDTIGDLADDMRAIPAKFETRAPKVVAKNAREGNKRAQIIARTKAGPHGKNYWKRLTSEMTGPLSAEYGPEGDPKTDFVGVGFRHGGNNNDLPESADLQAPKFVKDIGDIVDGLFW